MISIKINLAEFIELNRPPNDRGGNLIKNKEIHNKLKYIELFRKL